MVRMTIFQSDGGRPLTKVYRYVRKGNDAAQVEAVEDQISPGVNQLYSGLRWGRH